MRPCPARTAATRSALPPPAEAACECEPPDAVNAGPQPTRARKASDSVSRAGARMGGTFSGGTHQSTHPQRGDEEPRRDRACDGADVISARPRARVAPPGRGRLRPRRIDTVEGVVARHVVAAGQADETDEVDDAGGHDDRRRG